MSVFINEQHTFRRCSFIATMCFVSLLSWTYDSFYAPVQNKVTSLHTINGLFFLFYLLWDLYQMMYSSYKKQLYRLDLVIHHLAAFVLTAGCLPFISLAVSRSLITESVSLMNYIWKDKVHFIRLNIYRLFTIICIRLPYSIFSGLYYLPAYINTYKQEHSVLQLNWLYVMNNIIFLAVLYDLYLMKRIKDNLQR